MTALAVLAEAFRYPAPGKLERLEQMLLAVPDGKEKRALQRFLEGIRDLGLGEWEELYTRTWDLNPLTPPYIGFQIWGEDYRRGSFMARLQAEYRRTGIDPAGELPDHLAPVLAYLDAAAQPLPDLVEVFGQAVEKMAAALRKRDAGNPYLHLLNGMAGLEQHLAGPASR
ncbi:MAG: nitrate reductase [Chloroflexi bacterium]|jgi:nitrate reductase delta subunit|nr:nitrate reductase [Chloroflexota bacterium]